MSEARYGILQAVADLRRAGLLYGVLAAREGKLAPVTPGADESTSALVTGGFLGAGIDSRALGPDELFVALPGRNVHGRQFIPAALQAGHWILTDLAGEPTDDEAGVCSADPLANTPAAPGSGVLLTSDPIAALAELATSWRQTLPVKIVAITGTNGKTTTKDLLASLLAGAGPTHATAGNFNNDLGLPLTLLGLRRQHRFAVVEMGASAIGDIARLAPLAGPEVGVITNAGEAHLAEFGSLDNIIQGKGELLDILPPTGAAILNADSPGFRRWLDRAPCPVVSFGQEAGDHRYRWQTGSGTAGRPEVVLDGETWQVPLPGEHNGANLVAAILAARSLGVTDQVMAPGLAEFQASAHRSIVLDMGGRTILDDCYNANPRSMLAAADALVHLPGAGRNLAVLGQMAELGADSDPIHRRTGEQLATTGLEVLLAVGPAAEQLAVGFASGGKESHYFPTVVTAADWLTENAGAADRLLVKGSRSAAMEEILPLLRERWRRKGN